jgi:hypothetical protein
MSLSLKKKVNMKHLAPVVSGPQTSNKSTSFLQFYGLILLSSMDRRVLFKDNIKEIVTRYWGGLLKVFLYGYKGLDIL